MVTVINYELFIILPAAAARTASFSSDINSNSSGSTHFLPRPTTVTAL